MPDSITEVLDDWTSSLERGNIVTSVFLDFAKAFDSVPHKRLLKKLDKYEINPKVVKWIESMRPSTKSH